VTGGKLAMNPMKMKSFECCGKYYETEDGTIG
jgi:hypothetical protein